MKFLKSERQTLPSRVMHVFRPTPEGEGKSETEGGM